MFAYIFFQANIQNQKKFIIFLSKDMLEFHWNNNS